jgi:hypothetical protein
MVAEGISTYVSRIHTGLVALALFYNIIIYSLVCSILLHGFTGPRLVLRIKYASTLLFKEGFDRGQRNWDE